MKKILKIFLPALVVAIAFSACDKDDALSHYQEGAVTQLTTSTTTPSTALADADKEVVTFSWTDPGYATNESNYKYVVEIAPAGTDFANAAKYTVLGNRAFSLTGAQLNNLLVAWGTDYGATKDLDVRLRSSYANNNEMYLSNVIGMKAAPTALPFAFTASATGPFAPTAFTKDDKFTTLTWTEPKYGDTTTISYAIESAKTGSNFENVNEIKVGDALTHDLTGLELYSMAVAAGLPLDQEGSVDVRIKATVNNTNQASYSTNTISLKIKPAEMILYLYMAGDFQGWDPGSAPSIASNDGINYEGYVWVPAGGSGEFKFTSENSWSGTNYGGTSGATGGTIDGADNTNLKWPATGKYYLVKVNMTAKTWTVTEISTWGLIGDATPGGWDTSTPLTYNATTKKWTATVPFGSGSWKFRANNGWDINLGGSATYLSYGGDNIASPGGTKTISLDVSNPLKYTYTVQ